jgi:NADH-quinone oxidoreductase subunit M
MVPFLLILLPLLAGILSFFFKNGKDARSWGLGISLVNLSVAIIGISIAEGAPALQKTLQWMQPLGSSFAVKMDGLGKILCLLTAVAFPLIIAGTWQSGYKKMGHFIALLLLGQAGLMGVFLAFDALVFYFFWELALIPMYFLCSQWGGERRIRVTFKFFIYTFIGSLLMLVGIIFLQSKTTANSFSYAAINFLELPGKTQSFVFWLFFLAFAIKMPIFPFHTWQPDAYEQSPAPATMVMSGIMVKMGLLGLIRWLLPIVPAAFHIWGDVVMSLSVFGIVYASLIAIRQDDLKRLVAYSSIAHIGLMCMAVFAENKTGMQGAMIQMFNHGINIIGLWIMVEIIERKFGTRKISELGGLAAQYPAMAVFFVIIALANIALPLTNAFAGEFLMFNGLLNTKTVFLYRLLYTVFAGTAIILAAVYTLNMVRKVFYGEIKPELAGKGDLSLAEKLTLGAIVAMIVVIGFYPQLLLDITDTVSSDTVNQRYVPPVRISK